MSFNGRTIVNSVHAHCSTSAQLTIYSSVLSCRIVSTKAPSIAIGERPVFRCGDLKVDLVRSIVTMRDQETKLLQREYGLLCLLIAHVGKVVTHRHILRDV